MLALFIGALISPVVFLLVLVVYFIVTLVMWASGQTIGKAALEMRVIKTDGLPAGFWTMFLREVPGKFISGLPLYLGYFWSIWDKDEQSWHDKIAGTLVISKQ